jgi:hypothetical protein
MMETYDVYGMPDDRALHLSLIADVNDAIATAWVGYSKHPSDEKPGDETIVRFEIPPPPPFFRIRGEGQRASFSG